MNQALFATCAIAALVAPAIASDGWSTDLPAALSQAAAENKVVFVDFNGSDWCPPCQYLKSQILDKSEFADYAKDSLILVDVDIPNGDKLSAEQKQINRALAERYKIQGFPTILVLNKDGIVLGGFVGAKNNFAELKVAVDKALASKDAVDAAMDAANKLSGLEKAKALQAVAELCPADLRDNNVVLKALIVEADVDDALGYAAADKLAAENKAAKAEVDAILRNTEPSKRLAAIEEQLKRSDLSPALKSNLTWARFDLVLMNSKTVEDIAKMKAEIIAFGEANPSEQKKVDELVNGLFTIPAETLLQRIKQMQGK